MARSFSGDKTQLVPLIKAAIEHNGAAFIDVISPCVAFNNHAGSTKSFDYVREHNEAVNRLDFITGRAPITVDYAPGTVQVVEQHDGTKLRAAQARCRLRRARPARGDERSCRSTPPRARSSPACSMSMPRPRTCTATSTPSTAPLNALGEKELCPGSAALEKINASLR